MADEPEELDEPDLLRLLPDPPTASSRQAGRRRWLQRALAGFAASSGGWPALAAAQTLEATAPLRPRVLQFPRDFGSHPEVRTEWWYVTGWLAPAGAGGAAPAVEPSHGFQLTFFRRRTGLGAGNESAFAARQLLLAHAALTDLAAGRLRHDQRVARSGFGLAEASLRDTQVHVHAGSRWELGRTPDLEALDGRTAAPAQAQGDRSPHHGRYRLQLTSAPAGVRLDLQLAATQPLLLQGESGWSRKGPRPEQASFYYSQPQLAVDGQLQLDGGEARAVQGRAWLDHEWSEALLDAEAVGWDWLGINLFDGSVLTAFRLRRREGHPAGVALWAGGSWRSAGGASRSFAPGAVNFIALKSWTSPRQGRSGAVRYPVHWRIETPAGNFVLKALVEDQEIDGRASTGTLYWEGLSELLDAGSGRRVGLGYLEMTGYADRPGV